MPDPPSSTRPPGVHNPAAGLGCPTGGGQGRTTPAPRRLPSSRFRARYRGPDGRRHAKVFRNKAEAWAWLATQETDLLRRSWRAPNASRRTVGEYAEDYLARTYLRKSTRVLYAGLWRHHLAQPWAHVPVDEVTPAAVRSWHAKAGRATGPTALAQSYRLLRAILNVAVADEAIASNPCRLRGAGTPKATRPSRALTAVEALQLAEQLGRDRRTTRYRALLLVLAFGGLRFGEATALSRSDVLPGGRLRVERSVRRVGGRWVVGEPKTDAGHRTVTLPAAIADLLEEHLEKHVPRVSGRSPVLHRFRRLPRPQQLELDLPPRRRRHRPAGDPAARAPPHRRHPWPHRRAPPPRS
jgi:integrase